MARNTYRLIAKSDEGTALLADVQQTERDADHYARRYDLGNRAAWWSGLGLIWLSAALGVLSHVHAIAAYLPIDTLTVSLGTAAGAGIETFRRRSFWRQMADAYWQLAVDCDEVIERYHYRMAGMSEVKRVERTSEDFASAKDRFGERRDRIIEAREHGGAKAPPLENRSAMKGVTRRGRRALPAPGGDPAPA